MSYVRERHTVTGIQCLLQLLRKPASGDLSWLPAIQKDWRPFAAACDIHHLVPFVFCHLRDVAGDAVPAGLLEHLRARFYEISANNYRLAKKLADLTSLLQSHGVPVLAYKGPALAIALYGNLALRQYSDLDLVVRKEHLLKAVGAMSHCGFEIVPTIGRPQMLPYLCRPENPRHLARAEEIPFRAPDKTYFVDVHWQLGHGPWRAFSPDVEKMWERTEKLDLLQGSVSTFCREDLFLALSYHGSKHRWSRLKWLLDVAELLRKAETLDWFRIEEMMRVRPRARASASLAILLAQELLNAPVTTEVARIVPSTSRIIAEAAAIREEIFLLAQTSGDDYPTLLALEERPLARLKYRANRMLQYPGGVLSEIVLQVSPKDHAFITLPEKLRFLYHVIRPARLAVKHSRRAIRALWDRVSLIYETGRSSTSG